MCNIFSIAVLLIQFCRVLIFIFYKLSYYVKRQCQLLVTSVIGHIANSILLVTGGRKEPMAEVFAGNNLETSITVHTNHHSPSLVP